MGMWPMGGPHPHDHQCRAGTIRPITALLSGLMEQPGRAYVAVVTTTAPDSGRPPRGGQGPDHRTQLGIARRHAPDRGAEPGITGLWIAGERGSRARAGW